MTAVLNITKPYVVFFAATGDHIGRYTTATEAEDARTSENAAPGEVGIVRVGPDGDTVDWL